MPPPLRRALPWLMALLPWLVPALVVALQQRPDSSRLVDLRGAWAWKAGEALSPPPMDPPRVLLLPGFFARQGAGEKALWLERRVEVPTTGVEDWTLVLGDTRTAVFRAWLNGNPVGPLGGFAASEKAEFNGLESLTLPGALVRPGLNTLTLEVRADAPGYAGVGDHRLFLGPAAQVEPWVLRTQRLEAFLRTAPLLVLSLLSMLLLVMATLAGDRTERLLSLQSTWLAAGSSGYLLLHTGLGLTGWVGPMARSQYILVSVVWILTAFTEFSTTWLHGAPSRLAKVNRAVAALVLVVFAGLRVAGHSASFSLWRVYSPWPMVVLIILSAQVLSLLRTRRDALTVLYASTILGFVATGIADTLGDLGLLQVPRLFAMTLVNAPLLAGAVVVTRFVGLADRNRALSASLQVANEELTVALGEAREATRVKSEFLASVSHELRTPLNSLINIPEGLLEDFPREGGEARFVGDPGQVAHYLESMHRSGVHLLGVVNQVLDFSKLEADRMSLLVEPIDTAALLDDVTRTLEGLAKARGLSLVVTGDTRLAWAGDRVKVAQVLLNLGNNALKFSPDGGRVTFDVQADGGGVAFSVRDEGIGIAPEHHAMVFESFRQVEGGATRKYGGTGLGLPISRKLTELHGGTLTLVSEVGRGSTFTARFPAKPVSPASR